MNEVWGEKSGDAESWNLEALRTEITAGLNRSPSIPAYQFFAELRAPNAAKS